MFIPQTMPMNWVALLITFMLIMILTKNILPQTHKTPTKSKPLLQTHKTMKW